MAALVILVAQGHLTVLQSHEPVVGDRHTVSIAGQVLQDMLRVLEGLCRVDHPLLVAQRGEAPLPRLGLGECATATRQGQVALRIELLQPRQVQTPKAPREDADGQEEVGSTRQPLGPVGRQAPRGQDTMQMRVMVQLLAPGVQHREATDLGPEMFGVLGNVLERLGDGAKEQAIEGAGVLQGQGPQVVRQGKDDMRIGRVEYLMLSGGEPRGLGGAMTCGTATVATGVIRLLFMPAVVALRDMAAEGSRATERDGPQGTVLFTREGGPIAVQKGGAMLAHHLGDFKGWATHGRVPRSAGNASASKGLAVACSAGWATCR